MKMRCSSHRPGRGSLDDVVLQASLLVHHSYEISCKSEPRPSHRRPQITMIIRLLEIKLRLRNRSLRSLSLIPSDIRPKARECSRWHSWHFDVIALPSRLLVRILPPPLLFDRRSQDSQRPVSHVLAVEFLDSRVFTGLSFVTSKTRKAVSEAIITATQASVVCQRTRQVVSGGLVLLVLKPAMRITTQMTMKIERLRKDPTPNLVMNFMRE